METHSIRVLKVADGTWKIFEDDWKAQCVEAGEDWDEYSPDTLAVLRRIAEERTPHTTLQQAYAIGVARETDGRFVAMAMLNRAMLPNTDGYTLRVRHLMVSPLLDYGVWDDAVYADTIIGALSGIIHVSANVYVSKHIRFHLRSPEDMDYFRVMSGPLGRSPMFTSVQMRGAWLHLTRDEAVSAVIAGA